MGKTPARESNKIGDDCMKNDGAELTRQEEFTENEHPYKQNGMRNVAQLIEFIKNKPDYISEVEIKSHTFVLNIPVNDKDVMCMKIIELIKDEYGDHTVGEALEMLMDTIWWLQTISIAFPGKEITKRDHK